ncbi:MAG: LON peptidase substrate-binding domain-containing protein [Maritimibacter harenae]|jgi:Lon protease-like protein|uniref:ATP-dependent protease n=1 Tax=Maritimibacter harenae TaxID=2606218 RepID=A0A845M6B4_9RHOB|nr:LON peptidase substrate-binding domain-containing protein [Maritimibacter harenae]MZR15116.1 ATP-dependent protease [Maritimibacter harenae]
MIPRADLPDVVPIFPLPGALLLPRGRLPLNIFEPRYLAMFDDALKTEARLIGMIQPAVADGSRLHAIGCAGRITSFTETDDNRYMIQLTGVSRFRVVEEVEGFTPYRRAKVKWDGFERDLGRTEKDPGLNRETFLDLLARYFDVADLRTDWGSLKEAEDELLINSLSMLCPFDPEDKQALLEAPSLTTRRETLVTLMEFALAQGRGGEGSLQ